MRCESLLKKLFKHAEVGTENKELSRFFYHWRYDTLQNQHKELFALKKRNMGALSIVLEREVAELKEQLEKVDSEVRSEE